MWSYKQKKCEARLIVLLTKVIINGLKKKEKLCDHINKKTTLRWTFSHCVLIHIFPTLDSFLIYYFIITIYVLILCVQESHS